MQDHFLIEPDKYRDTNFPRKQKPLVCKGDLFLFNCKISSPLFVTGTLKCFNCQLDNIDVSQKTILIKCYCRGSIQAFEDLFMKDVFAENVSGLHRIHLNNTMMDNLTYGSYFDLFFKGKNNINSMKKM